MTEIREGLLKKGHKIVDAENYNNTVDAIIYEGNIFQVSCVSRNNTPEMSSGGRSNYGVLMINSLGKSIDQIDEMLHMKNYSHMF